MAIAAGGLVALCACPEGPRQTAAGSDSSRAVPAGGPGQGTTAGGPGSSASSLGSAGQGGTGTHDDAGSRAVGSGLTGDAPAPLRAGATDGGTR